MKKMLLALLLSVLANIGSAQDIDVIFGNAENLFANGDYQNAANLYTKVLLVDSENMNAYLRRGFCNSVLQNYDDAIADFSVVIERHQDHPFAYISRGSAYNKKEQFQKALADFDKALNLDPTNQEAYNNRGWAKNGMELYDEACADWKKSKQLGNEEAKIILKNNHCK